MSKVFINAGGAFPIQVEQDRRGVATLVYRLPMTFDKSTSGLQVPKPPELPHIAGYGVDKVTAKRERGGAWSWEVTYAGPGVIQPDGEEDGKVYRFEPADAELPITSHPDIAKFIKHFEGRTDASGRVVFGKLEMPKDADGAGVQEALDGQKKNPFFGVESYLSFGGTWSIEYTAKSPPADLFRDVERVVATVPMPKWFRLPGVEKRNWLKRMPTIEFRGRAVAITERYLLSGLGGFNRAIYSGRQNA